MRISDWVGILGPGGLIALVIALDRVVRNYRAAKANSLTAAIDQWQELLKEREHMVRNQRRILAETWSGLDYWRQRAAAAEFLCRVNNIPLPPPPPEPEKVGLFKEGY